MCVFLVNVFHKFDSIDPCHWSILVPLAVPTTDVRLSASSVTTC